MKIELSEEDKCLGVLYNSTCRTHMEIWKYDTENEKQFTIRIFTNDGFAEFLIPFEQINLFLDIFKENKK